MTSIVKKQFKQYKHQLLYVRNCLISYFFDKNIGNSNLMFPSLISNNVKTVFLTLKYMYVDSTSYCKDVLKMQT